MRHNHKAVVVAVLAAFVIGFGLYSIPPIAEIFMLGVQGGAGGAGVGLLLAAAFTTPVLVTHELFGGVGPGAIAVDAANTILSGTAMGWILGAWRPRGARGSP